MIRFLWKKALKNVREGGCGVKEVEEKQRNGM